MAATSTKPKEKGKHGGPRPNSGRPKGKASKSTELTRLRLISSGEQLPVDFFLSVMRNDEMPFGLRFEAAKEAAPYCHARVTVNQSFGSNGSGNNSSPPGEIVKVERAIVTFEGEWSDINNPDDARIRAALISEKVQGS